MAQRYDAAIPANEIPVQLGFVARALRRRRRIRLFVRALWMALAVWSVGLFALLLGLQVPTAPLAGATLLTLAAGVAYGWLSHPSLARLARGLDRHYNLAQQLTTALEVARQGQGQPLEQRLLDETETLLERMRRFVASHGLMPWRELEMLAAVFLLAAGLTVAVRPLLPEAASPVALPELPPPAAPSAAAAAQPTEQPVNEQKRQELAPEAQAAADAIADALRDNGATRSAAEALDRGDTAGAASELRELADQAEQLGDQARQDIAEGLRDAAEELGASQPGLSDELRRQADALEQGGQAAEQALEDLARTVEQLSEAGQQAAEAPQPSPAGPGQGAGNTQPSAQSAQQDQGGAGAGAGNGNQLGGEQRGAQPGTQAQGETLPLPQPSTAGGPTTSATGPKGPTVELEAGGTGETQNAGGGNADQPLAGEADPLAIPLEYRDVVEDYFSPQP